MQRCVWTRPTSKLLIDEQPLWKLWANSRGLFEVRVLHALAGTSNHVLFVLDFVATSFLEGMQNQVTAESVDRTLRKLSDEKALEVLSSREPRLPADSLIAAYFASYRTKPLPELPASPTIADGQLLLASQALQAKDYKHAVVLVNESLMPLEAGQELSSPALKAEALTLRGSFK